VTSQASYRLHRFWFAYLNKFYWPVDRILCSCRATELRYMGAIFRLQFCPEQAPLLYKVTNDVLTSRSRKSHGTRETIVTCGRTTQRRAPSTRIIRNTRIEKVLMKRGAQIKINSKSQINEIRLIWMWNGLAQYCDTPREGRNSGARDVHCLASAR
jgi:hypothetical protein